MNVTFPEQYQAEELAGKAATFKVKLHEVKTRSCPPRMTNSRRMCLNTTHWTS